ncbi:CD2-associated protein isoform X2 [Sardina pilchardus]|uniref:CD2-associated protein isoform X2 n=1 Tax=Sardina pilchardus TaxID=27697 RepID=UPI002E157DDD
MVEVVVEYEYEAAHEDELTLRPGDVIKNVRRVEEEGWMEGELKGKKGLFPDNFVKDSEEVDRKQVGERDGVGLGHDRRPVSNLGPRGHSDPYMEIKNESKETKEVKEESQPTRRGAGNVASLVQRISTYGIPAGGFQPSSQPRVSKKTTPLSSTQHTTGFHQELKKRQCKALFDYVPQNEDELELKVGDVVEITEEVEEGWWSGVLNGKFGLFPSNFVKEMEESDDADADNGNTEADCSSKDGISTPMSPHSGNETKAQPKKVKGVGFGDIFSQGSVKLKVRLPTEVDEKKEKPVPSLPSAAKITHSNTTESLKIDGESKTKVKEYCKASYAYDATNQDELDIKEGDVIEILTKDTGEPGWWRGEINGREGVFPDNFVVLISEIDKEKPKKPPPPLKTTGDKMVPDHKPSKPAAPMVPPKKPIPPPGKGRSGAGPPKRPEKPLASSPATPAAKHNGEVPTTRPKSDLEPALHTKPKTLSGDWGEKTAETIDLMSFDDVSATSEKLSHPTANRPKMPGRRLPAQFGGPSPSKEAGDTSQRAEEDEVSQSNLTKPSDLGKPLVSTASSGLNSKVNTTIPTSPEIKSRAGREKEKVMELDELRTQMKEVLLTVELLKTQQMRELAELRNDLEDERSKRMALQIEIDKLKKMLQLT